MALRLARTNAEAHLYMDMHPCEVCGSGNFSPRSSVITAEDDLASRYAGACGSCGNQREFVFRLPEQVMLPSGGGVRFGGDQPSELLDPGEWLWVADRAGARIAGDPAAVAPADRAAWRSSLETAVAAMDEVLKFVPAGADEVPAAAFVSERGQAVRDDEPGRFRRFRLEAVRDAYRELLDGATA